MVAKRDVKAKDEENRYCLIDYVKEVMVIQVKAIRHITDLLTSLVMHVDSVWSKEGRCRVFANRFLT